LKRVKRIRHRYRKASRSREARIGITLGILVSVAAIAAFLLMNATVIEIDSKLVITTPKEQHQLASPSVTVSSNKKSAKPFGLALSTTLYGLSKSQLNSELNELNTLGVSWIRIDVAWAGVQPNNSSQYDWSPVDTIVSAASSHHLSVLATLAYTPSWAAQSGCNDASQKCAPANDSQFAAFATAAAQRYGHKGVDAWEIWNEPNDQGFWAPAPNPEAYTKLLEASYVAIKKVDGSATVLSGGLGPLDSLPGSIEPVTFLSDLYADGAKGYFDAVGFHPYSYPNLPATVAAWSGWSMMDDLPTSARSVMVANGDSDKQLWITEYGAPTGGPGQTETSDNYGQVGGDSNVDDQLQAEMLTQSTQQYDGDSWLGNYFWYSYKDLGTSETDSENFFGLYTYGGAPKPALTALEQAIHDDK
jgi:hypothetical protein